MAYYHLYRLVTKYILGFKISQVDLWSIFTGYCYCKVYITGHSSGPSQVSGHSLSRTATVAKELKIPKLSFYAHTVSTFNNLL